MRVERRQGSLTCVSGQDPCDGGKTGGNAQSRIFEHPEDDEGIR